MTFDAKEFLDLLQKRLPEGHEITGLTVEISRPVDKDFTIRCNGGTYKELAEQFEGTPEQFVDDIIKGYVEASQIADKQFAKVIEENRRDA
jgi:hypothetical protein